jgi:hypothetical protein
MRVTRAGGGWYSSRDSRGQANTRGRAMTLGRIARLPGWIAALALLAATAA